MKSITFLYVLIVFAINVISIKSVASTTNTTLSKQVETNNIQLIKKYAQILTATNVGFVELLNQVEVESIVSDQTIMELFENKGMSESEMLQLLHAMDAEGKWSDVNYSGKLRSGWEPCQHLRKLLKLSQYYFRKPSAELKEGIHKAIQIWIAMDLKCPNWWYNEIGAPLALGKAAICFYNELSQEELVGITKVLDRAKFGRTGQNKVWLAGNVLIKALLNNDSELLVEAQQQIASEITIGNKEGVQVDGSFRQHGPQQQWGNYGLAYLMQMSFYANLFEGSKFAFSSEKRSIINKLLLEGYRYVIYGRRLEMNALDRQISHNVAQQKALCVLLCALRLRDGCPLEDIKDLDAFINEVQKGKQGTVFIGSKYFPQVNQTIHRQKAWMASVKMASKDIIGVENVNKDNMKGFYGADGATFVYVTGHEYDNVFPLWDFRKIPGITCYNTLLPIPRADTPYGKKRLMNNTDKVFAETSGDISITAMDVNRDGIRAHKAWVMTKDLVICLGSGINTDSILSLQTTIEQRVPGSLPVLLTKAGKETIKGNSCFTGQFPRLYADNICYIPLSGDSLYLNYEETKGDWHECVDYYPQWIEKGNMFTVYFGHKKENASYAYLILPAVSQSEAMKYDCSNVSILENTEKSQKLTYKDTWIEIDWDKAQINLTPVSKN